MFGRCWELGGSTAVVTGLRELRRSNKVNNYHPSTTALLTAVVLHHSVKSPPLTHSLTLLTAVVLHHGVKSPPLTHSAYSTRSLALLCLQHSFSDITLLTAPVLRHCSAYSTRSLTLLCLQHPFSDITLFTAPVL